MALKVEDLRVLWGKKTHRELKLISDACGVPVGTVYNIAKGRTKRPRVDTFLKLASHAESQGAAR